MTYSLEYSDAAQEQLYEILSQRFESTGNWNSVDGLLLRLERAYATLRCFPRYGGSFKNDPNGCRYRKLVVGEYVVIYSIDEQVKRVHIEALFHHRQNYEELI